MSPQAWITMFAVMGFVWGGFGLALYTAIRSEARKGE
jgi:hypothetical protein